MHGRPTSPVIKKRRRYFLAGLLTVIPLWVTFLVLAFLFRILSNVGRPAVHFLSNLLAPQLPELAGVMESIWFQRLMAVLLVLAVLYGLGVVTTWVIGRRVLAWFERILEQIPIVKSVYGATKKLIIGLQETPGGSVERVVLIDFPSPEMKTVGLVTRILTDSDTGRQLAAVYVPTTPNPTSGYLEIVPVEKITSTNWTLDEAMSFIISGGSTAPERMNYDISARRPSPTSETAS